MIPISWLRKAMNEEELPNLKEHLHPPRLVKGRNSEKTISFEEEEGSFV